MNVHNNKPNMDQIFFTVHVQFTGAFFFFTPQRCIKTNTLTQFFELTLNMETQHRHVPLALIQYLGHITDVGLKLTFGNSVKLISLHKLSSDFDTNIDNIQKNDTVKLSRSVQSSRDHRHSAPTV